MTERSDVCPQCGGVGGADACREAFARLLALDHSREEPWGPRHGLAVAVYTLQHPLEVPRDRLETCWLIVWRCAMDGDDPVRLAAGIRRSYPVSATAWGAPPLPPAPDPGGFAVTILDLGAFEAGAYPEALLGWARATLDRWREGRPG